MDTALATYRFSVEEFNKLGEVGIFSKSDRVELLDGEIVLMSPIGRNHGAVVMRLSFFFSDKLRGRALLSPQLPAVLDDYSEPLPDIMLLRPKADFYTSGHPRAEDIFLLVEVSDTSLAYDRGRKLRKYAEAGVGEVWIVNVKAQRIEQHRAPSDGEYSVSENKEREEIGIAAFPDVLFKVEELIG